MWTRRQFLASTGTSAAAAALAATIQASAATTQSDPQPEILSPVAAASGVLERALGTHASRFKLSLFPASSPTAPEEYEVEAAGGVVTIRGTSAVALCRAAYSYLREQCGAMITWSGQHLDLPQTFPDLPKTTVQCPYRHVQYLNPCTFGYTMAFWDWARWERELDWMALHGVTMPLAMEGQEWVWQKVWLSLGLSQAEIDAFTTGPAHLPWHRMGNINDFEGPLSQNWVEEQHVLQRRILDRMRSLGMKPVVPAFSGFVPKGFLRVYPDAEAFTLLWLANSFATIPRNTRTFILHPRQDALYREIGKRFIETYKKTYGEVEYYLADTFNELAVPVSEDHRYDDLELFGRTVYGGIQAGDPNGTWVMQSWLFVFDPFWDAPSMEALLRGVPNDRMLILDYSNDLTRRVKGNYATNPWKRSQAFFGKQWTNGMTLDHGGNNNVKGNLALLASAPAEVLSSPDKGNLVGWSICPEGIESNEVAYELMTDAGWRSAPIDLELWIPKYCKARYGKCPPAMAKAWKLLRESAYGEHVWNTRHAWQCEPSLTPAGHSVNASPQFVEATTLFLSCAPDLAGNQLYRNDLIEFVAQSAGGWVDQQLALATELIRSQQTATAKIYANHALDMLTRIDALMNLRPDRRLETWVAAARAKAKTPDEAAFYDENARTLITTWGWPELSDYASRVWSGLIRDYYKARWSAWFEHQWTGNEFSLDLWQQAWLSRPYKPSTPAAVPDLVAAATAMLADCKSA
jgi:alpha-N-acetylglucosaminidase